MPRAEREGLFGGVFARGEVETGSRAWLRAMLDTEAALAGLPDVRAGLAEAGVTDAHSSVPRSARPVTWAPHASSRRPPWPPTG